MSGGSPGASTLFPYGQEIQQFQVHWGVYATAATLPNGAGNILVADKFVNLRVGHIADVTGVGLYLCTVVGTAGGGDATWSPITAATPFVWNLNEQLEFASWQAATFDGFLVTNPALSGDGPFDGTRYAEQSGSLYAMRLLLRTPPLVTGTVSVECYRVRSGVVASLGVLGVTTAAPNAFSTAMAVPVPADVLVDDLFFVSVAAQVPVGARDLSVYLSMRPL